MHEAKYGRALNETGTAQLRRQAAHKVGASEWNCCRFLCGLLFRFAQLLVFYAVLLLDICESFFVLCYSEYLIFVYVYADPPNLFTVCKADSYGNEKLKQK